MKKLILLGCALTMLATVPAHAQEGDESGLAKKYRISIGGYGAGSQNAFTNAVISGSGQDSGFTFKLDLVTSRPTRHETLFSYQYMNNVLGLGDGSMAYGEYRWRFDKFGRAYYGINVGFWKLHSNGGDALFASGSSLGYHFNKDTFVELRYSQLETDATFSSLMIGKRF